MKLSNSAQGRSNTYPAPSTRWLVTILILGILFIFYVTFFPFDFFLQTPPTIADILQNFDRKQLTYFASKDAIRNILLFLPIGFALTGISIKLGIKKYAAFMLTLIMGASLSTGIEFLQMFSISRFPTIFDVLANTVGAILGFFIFIKWGAHCYCYWSQLILWLDSKLSFRKLIVIYVVYVIALVAFSLYFQRQLSFNNWATQFPLILGNEYTENRPWNGFLTDVYLFDEAIGQEDILSLYQGQRPNNLNNKALLASYNFTGNEASNFPALEWIGNPALGRESEGALLSEGQWLISESGGRLISRNLRDKNAFTLGFIGAPIKLEQGGPARIISISGSTVDRNLTVGQLNNDLHLRIRTPFTDQNGRYPEFIFPDVFLDSEFQHIIITYSGSAIQLYINNEENVYTLEPLPVVLLFSLLHPTSIRQIRINQGDPFIYMLLYAALFLIPLVGIVIYKLRKEQTNGQKSGLLIIGVASIAPLLLESCLTFLFASYSLQSSHIILQILLFLLTASYLWWITHPSASMPQKNS